MRWEGERGVENGLGKTTPWPGRFHLDMLLCKWSQTIIPVQREGGEMQIDWTWSLFDSDEGNATLV